MAISIKEFRPGTRGDNLVTPNVETSADFAAVERISGLQAMQREAGNVEFAAHMRNSGRWPSETER